MEGAHAGAQAAGDMPNGSGHEAKALQPIDISDEKRQAQEASRGASAPQDAEKSKDEKSGQEKQENKNPPGGYDSTPIPYRPGGYTVKITIHRATNLPMADINSLSSDPYVLAECKTDNPMRHKEDPPIIFRTPTIRRNTDPEWNAVWIVANAPADGFKLKLRVYDEDPANKDDRLGNVHINVPALQGWAGLQDERYHIEKKTGSKRAYVVRAVATCFRVAKHMHGDV